jgi:hypothetical protein
MDGKWFEEKLRKLAAQRRDAERLKKTFDQVYAAFLEENGGLVKTRESVTQAIADLELELRDAAVEAYHENPESKQIAPGLGIRTGEQYEYPLGEAEHWAIEHRMCLSLDGKAFRDICKNESTRPSFVKAGECVAAIIAKDLSPLYGDLMPQTE